MNSSHDDMLNDGQAKRKVGKLGGSWAVADNQAKLRRAVSAVTGPLNRAA